MKSILIVLPDDRLYPGQLTVEDEDGAICFGPVPCLGKADNSAAAEHDNQSRDPSKPWGDTPLGDYTGQLRHVPDTPADEHSFGTPDSTGAIPVIHLAPSLGDSQAWVRQAAEGLGNDIGLMIHCRADENTTLYPTHGCIRLFQKDMTALLAQVAGMPTFSVKIESKEQGA